jgi:hypothetical protein
LQPFQFPIIRHTLRGAGVFFHVKALQVNSRSCYAAPNRVLVSLLADKTTAFRFERQKAHNRTPLDFDSAV